MLVYPRDTGRERYPAIAARVAALKRWFCVPVIGAVNGNGAGPIRTAAAPGRRGMRPAAPRSPCFRHPPAAGRAALAHWDPAEHSPLTKAALLPTRKTG